MTTTDIDPRDDAMTAAAKHEAGTNDEMTTEDTEAAAELAGIVAEHGDPDPDDTTEESADRDDPAAKARREAKGLRERLRTAESERDTLAARVEAMTAAEVDRLAAEHLARGADLREVGGVAVADLLTDDGLVDPDKVREAASGLLAERGYLGVRRFAGSADSGARTQSITPTPTWSDLFTGGKQ